MSDITITIDGREIKTSEGEYILNAARANDIFIPAICYLTRCSPTLACRICLVEADGKQVYACNAKAKDGMNITTTTENIESERRAIMEVYDVNHPLACGVCDQSGECELQNYTLEMGVDSQSYNIKDTHRPAENWGLLNYDPSLCIMCERCITACKDMIGDAALSTKARGSDAITPEQKESMPKDAYAMWNKLNKSLIAPNAGDHLDCTDCGECSAVCPVGALVSHDFQYTTNAWELTKIPATCSHCSAGCSIYYEVKHTDIENSDAKIYRVQNEWNYVSLCGAGRYGYDFENRGISKDVVAFDRAIEAFKKADTISFSSFITNEEALILQKLKAKYGYKLINEDARVFREFLDNYSHISGKRLYSADLLQAHAANFVVSIGSALKTDNPNARFAFNNALSMNKGAGLYFHPIKDPVISGMSKSVTQIAHKPLGEEMVLYLMLDLFGDKESMPSDIVEFLASFHTTKMKTIEETIDEEVTETVVKKVVDEESGQEREVSEEVIKKVKKKITKEIEVDHNKIFDLLDAPEDFDDILEKYLAKKDSFVLMVGADLYTHPNSKNCARLVALIEKFTQFSVMMIPNYSNSLGVSLICELDKDRGSYTIGYNTSGDFTLSALGDGDLDMPALNQQEGTLTSIDKRVNPTNAALAYGGYVLNDIANALGLEAKYTIDYTSQLPESAGFKSIAFDDLENSFSNAGEDLRGYLLDNLDVTIGNDISIERFSSDALIDDEVIYLANPVLQFSQFTAASHQLADEGGVYLSSAFMSANSYSEGDRVMVKTPYGELEIVAKEDNKIDGDIGYLPTFNPKIDSQKLFDGYRFAKVSIKKV